MEDKNNNWSQSVAGVVINNGKVLLARHTYGAGKGRLIVPGGYVHYNESPQDALRREYMEETGVHVEPGDVIGVRFNLHDWYVVFSAKYISGEPVSDNDENSEVVWLDVEEAIGRDDVPDLTKKLISSALRVENGLQYTDYVGSMSGGPYTLYCV
jgi:8-oxo-dGTP pyrophosphatase MutT (NUDIX family)